MSANHDPLALLSRALAIHSQLMTAQTLGDRQRYVGMSDVATASACLRAAVARKLQPSRITPPDQNDLSRLLTLQRGHWLEDGLTKALHSSGERPLAQVEIAASFAGVPVKAHLDLTLVEGSETPSVQVLELKSTKHLPNRLLSSYEMQLYGQLGLLQACWSSPCFRIIDGHDRPTFTTFPRLAADNLGIDLPRDVRELEISGWVVCISMNDAKAFGPYQPHDAMLRATVDTACSLWRSLEDVRDGKIGLDDLSLCQGFNLQCDWCDCSADCPKFTPARLEGQPLELDASYDPTFQELANLKAHKAQLTAEIATLEDSIKGFARTFGRAQRPTANDWFHTPNWRFRLARVQGRSKLAPNRVLAELLALTQDETKAQDLFDSCHDAGSPSERLDVKVRRQAS